MDGEAHLPRRLLRAAGLLACCAACAGPPPSIDKTREVVLELAWTFPTAAVAAEVSVIEVGAESARPHLVSGWGEDERDEHGPYVWGLGPVSVVELYAAAPVDVTLGLSCAPFLFEGAPPQTVRPVLNGHDLGVVRLAGDDTTLYEVEAPARTLVAGTNQLVLAYGTFFRPQDVQSGSQDERRLAVMWRGIELRGLGARERPSTDDLREKLRIPASTEVAYYFDFTGPVELTAASVLAEGEEDVELVVSFTSEGEAEAWSTVLNPRDGEPLRVRLPPEEAGIGRLALVARRRGGLRGLFGHAGDGAVTLTLPTVRSLAEPAASPVRASVPPTPPNVVVYLVDTLRADHLGVYGYERPTSPELDRFARDAVTFENAAAPSSWTRPSVVSLLTGLRPWVHGVNRREDALSQDVETLAEILAAAGYETAAFITNGNVGPDFAVDQGFGRFRYLRESPNRPAVHQLSDRVNQAVFRWLANRDPAADGPAARKPFFLYVHTTDPHAPYFPPRAYRERFAPEVDPELGLLPSIHDLVRVRRGDAPPGVREALLDLYDGEIAFNDHHFGRLVAHLKELGLYEDALVVFVSDHGEAFRDHGVWGHGRTLYDEELRVPFLVKLPGGEHAGRRFADPVELIDVAPTILDLAGLVPPARLDGRSVRATLDGSVPGERSAFSLLSLGDVSMRAVLSHGFKLVLDDSKRRRGDPIQLYRLAASGENENLAPELPLQTSFLIQVLGRMELVTEADGIAEPDEAEISDELRRQLEALGYVN